MIQYFHSILIFSKNQLALNIFSNDRNLYKIAVIISKLIQLLNHGPDENLQYMWKNLLNIETQLNVITVKQNYI